MGVSLQGHESYDNVLKATGSTARINRFCEVGPLIIVRAHRPRPQFANALCPAGLRTNGSIYAWFGEYLASHGYLVAMVYHFWANTFDSSALYVRNKIWQRTRDVSLDICHLLHDEAWGPHIDPRQIGVAGPLQLSEALDNLCLKWEAYSAATRRAENTLWPMIHGFAVLRRVGALREPFNASWKRIQKFTADGLGIKLDGKA